MVSFCIINEFDGGHTWEPSSDFLVKNDLFSSRQTRYFLLVRNSKDHNYHKQDPPCYPILTHLTQIISSQPIFVRSILIAVSHLRISLTRGLFLLGFQTKILYAFLVSPSTCYIDHECSVCSLDYLRMLFHLHRL